ncbi:hypothetical protein [Gemmata sp.]|uniref:hypothetical protein n=1 Tax=Gemmata sp. TaxID=1914242 RepID=UPI003F6F89E7
MIAPADATDKLAAFRTRGTALTVTPVGTIRVRPAALLTGGDREWLKNNADALTAAAKAEMHRLKFEADAMVASLGVSGRHPGVAAAAGEVTAAVAAGDLERVRASVARFEDLVRGLASATRAA